MLCHTVNFAWIKWKCLVIEMHLPSGFESLPAAIVVLRRRDRRCTSKSYDSTLTLEIHPPSISDTGLCLTVNELPGYCMNLEPYISLRLSLDCRMITLVHQVICILNVHGWDYGVPRYINGAFDFLSTTLYLYMTVCSSMS